MEALSGVLIEYFDIQPFIATLAMLATIPLLAVVGLIFSGEDQVTMFSSSALFQIVVLVHHEMLSLTFLETVTCQVTESIYLPSTPTLL